MPENITFPQTTCVGLNSCNLLLNLLVFDVENNIKNKFVLSKPMVLKERLPCESYPYSYLLKVIKLVELINVQKSMSNKNAFQWDAYRPLVDRIPACTPWGGCLLLGCLPRWVSAWGCLPGRCIIACNGANPSPPVDRHLWKHNLRKLRLRAVINPSHSLLPISS